MEKIWQRLGRISMIICVIFTLVVGGVLVANSASLGKAIHIVRLIDSQYLEASSKDVLIEGAIAGMVDALGDRYSTYLDVASTQSLMDDVSGSFSGIGVYVGLNQEDQVVIVAPVEGGPSEKAGIQSGDIVMAVNDTTVGGMSLDKVVLMMKGEIGTQVELTVMRNKELETFQVTREVINEVTVSGTILEENEKIAYMRISKFSLSTAEEFIKKYNELTKEDFAGLIIDVRDNGGGEVNAACNIAQLFVPEGPIVHIVDKNGATETITATGGQVKVPVVMLVNGNSASASEILAGALKDTQAATLVGTTTFGKGLVQGVFFLPDGSSVKLTRAKYLTPNKNDINLKGINPDVVVDFPEDMTAENWVDVQLNKAIEVLENKM